ncbi:MAG TPA: hypothetical protein VLA64_03685 [Azonexus sp.]|nr:hypothetical protein [Azonexus sp.]
MCRNLVWTAAALFAAIGLNGAQGGMPGVEQPVASPLPSTTPPEIIKPAQPSALKDADAVFNELDLSRRGYVTLQETKDLIGFGEAFRAVDTKGSGKLTRAQFHTAWAPYKSVNK